VTDTSPIASTPTPPYVAVIFSSVRTDGDNGYDAMAQAMFELASAQPGFLGAEHAREDIGITVSYWRDEQAAAEWKQVAAHLVAQRRGKDQWYSDYRVRVARVLREYSAAESELS
jgi:heme-degrading monooxygenase HmoA